MDSQQASSGEHPKIIGPPNPENKLQTILEAVGKTIAAIEYGEVESRRGCTLRRLWFSTLVTAQPSPSRLAPTPGTSPHPETSPRRTFTQT
jgi:hypothetical protein